MAAELTALPAAERQVLAALAVVGRASLSSEELAELIEMDDVAPLIADLERRGLVRSDEKRRYSVLGRVGEEIRDTDAALATGDRLIKYFSTLAKGGALTPERLAEEAEAILGLSEWAANKRQWAGLLELVETLQSCFGIADRVQQWLGLLTHGRQAAQGLGDSKSEIWVLQQMATASQSAADVASAQAYLREAARLQTRPGDTRDLRRPDESVADDRPGVPTSGARRLWLWIVGLALAAGGGIGAGIAIGGDKADQGVTTASVPITLTVGGRTLTTTKTVTLPATTVTTTTTETTTETTTVTTTVTVQAGPR